MSWPTRPHWSGGRWLRRCPVGRCSPSSPWSRPGLRRGRVLAPLRLADAEATALLRAGDVVDVLAADPQAEQAFVAGRGVRVVTVPAPADPDAGADPAGALVLVEVDSETARVLARAAVSATLTVIWR